MLPRQWWPKRSGGEGGATDHRAVASPAPTVAQPAQTAKVSWKQTCPEQSCGGRRGREGGGGSGSRGKQHPKTDWIRWAKAASLLRVLTCVSGSAFRSYTPPASQVASTRLEAAGATAKVVSVQKSSAGHDH